MYILLFAYFSFECKDIPMHLNSNALIKMVYSRDLKPKSYMNRTIFELKQNKAARRVTVSQSPVCSGNLPWLTGGVQNSAVMRWRFINSPSFHWIWRSDWLLWGQLLPEWGAIAHSYHLQTSPYDRLDHMDFPEQLDSLNWFLPFWIQCQLLWVVLGDTTVSMLWPLSVVMGSLLTKVREKPQARLPLEVK